jgi:hypothetical protein
MQGHSAEQSKNDVFDRNTTVVASPLHLPKMQRNIITSAHKFAAASCSWIVRFHLVWGRERVREIAHSLSTTQSSRRWG